MDFLEEDSLDENFKQDSVSSQSSENYLDFNSYSEDIFGQQSYESFFQKPEKYSSFFASDQKPSKGKPQSSSSEFDLKNLKIPKLNPEKKIRPKWR